MLLITQNLSKSYSAIPVLDAVDLIIHKADRIGVVGPNGVGKSTLLRLLIGQEEADAGDITFAPSVQYGYLAQTTPAFYGRTMHDLLLEAVGNLRQLEERMHELESAMAAARSEELAQLLEEYTAISTHFQDSGGYTLDYKIETILAGLQLHYLPRTREVETLSSGEKARLQLATLLLRSPDLLLLDEPTNHLDFASMAWLENYLGTYQGAILMVSHDRQFLNRTVSQIYEIDEHTHHLTEYVGNYDAYSAAKRAERRQWEQEYERQQEKLVELRKYVRVTGKAEHVQRASNDKDGYHRYGYSFQSKQNAVASRLRSAQTLLEGIEDNLIPQPPEVLSINAHFSAETMQENAALLSLSHLSKYMGERCLFADLNMTIAVDSRILLSGPNGAGKTTLLKLMLGLETPTAGAVQVGAGARMGYLAQEPAFPDLHKTVIEAYRDGQIGYEEDFIAQLLNYGLFRPEDLPKQVGQLSVGQQRKLEIARLMAGRPNLLLLDEPTNYLSLDVLEAFEAAIHNFAGPVIVTSHDRWFIQRFKGEVWEIADGQCSPTS